MASTLTFQQAMRTALDRLGIERLVLSIHQASFPAGSDDIGHGTPYSERGRALVDWLAELGFTGISLGPAGITSRDNPSPYDSTALSRNPLHIALGPLCERGMLEPQALDAAVKNRPSGDRVAYDYAWRTQRRLLDQAAMACRENQSVQARLAELRRSDPWLEREARFEAVAAAIGHDDWQQWPASPPESDEAAERFVFAQWLVRDQHAAFRRHANGLGLRVYADLAIGVSYRDRFLARDLFLADYAMGAPPSRTNPAGQPWGYPVLAPAQLAPDGDGWRYVSTRLEAVLGDHDGMRIDHPHGWVCPWVYRTDDPSPLHAVQHGARLFESPDLPDHQALAAFSRVRPEQIERGEPRYADRWVRALESAQVDAYSRVFDLIVGRLLAAGRRQGDLLVEVLSTCPRPLAEVLARHHLGRYRVTQKAVVRDLSDVYRSDTARPEDWIMVGTHDTPPLRAVLPTWRSRGETADRAAYLASRLAGDSSEFADLERRFSQDDRQLATAMFADLFRGPARNVLIFWTDLFGLSEPYNRPGVSDATNWSLRLDQDFERAYRQATARGDAPDLARAVAWALHARRLDRDPEGQSLIAALCRTPSEPG